MYNPLCLDFTRTNKTRFFYTFGGEFHFRNLSHQNNHDNIKLNQSNINGSIGCKLGKVGSYFNFVRLSIGYTSLRHFRKVKEGSFQYGTIADISNTRLQGIKLSFFHGVNEVKTNQKWVTPFEWGVTYRYFTVKDRLLDNTAVETKGLNLWQLTLELKVGIGVVFGSFKHKARKSNSYHID